MGKEGERDKAAERAWGRVLTRLSAELGKNVIRDWFSHLSFAKREKDRIYLEAPTAFIAQHITAQHEMALRRAWMEEAPGIRRVLIRAKAERRVGSSEAARRGAPRPRAGGVIPSARLEMPLKKDLRFSSFIGGQENGVALRAAKRAALLEKGAALRSPLFLHGDAGFGKTHLMNAIALELRSRGEENLLFLGAERFRYHFLKALREKDALAFKTPFYELDVFLVDDLQFLTGDATQREFAHFVETLLSKGARIVLSADRPPSALEIFPPRLRSLLGSGLVADIQPAHYDLRLKILRSKLPSSPEGARMPSSILEFLARRVSANIRELEGALNRLLAYAELSKEPVSLEWAKRVLRDVLRSQTPTITVDKIQRAVAEHFGLTRDELLGRSRQQSVVRPRQIAIYLAKKLTRRSLPDLGRRFGGRDHTTIIHAIRRIEALCETDEQLQSEIAHLTRLLKNWKGGS